MDLIARAETAVLQTMLVTREPQALPPAPYASRAEMTRDMANPRYSADRNYRKAVADRLAATHANR